MPRRDNCERPVDLPASMLQLGVRCFVCGSQLARLWGDCATRMLIAVLVCFYAAGRKKGTTRTPTRVRQKWNMMGVP